MTPDQWRRIDNLFHEASALPTAERASFLQEACQGDEALRGEVQSLLGHAGQSGEIRAVLEEVAGRFSEEEAASLTGRQIGAYRINAVIGRGGMGVVCEAGRVDDQFHKQVAIKLIKRGMDTPLVIARFRQERQILAGLEHPGIARLLDGGATGDGQPYFVMERVEGLPITAYCDSCHLTIPQRLQLFRSVCEAVQYAHRNLVVHRDIKPSNILVTADGAPKLLDFGLAKVLTPMYSAESPASTILPVKMMTPDYASPEQVQGGRVTVATDIYSLGAVLYELLTGVRPHHFSEYSPGEIERVICQTEIERPSRAAGTSTQARGLAGDLDNIVLRALHKEAERRYASVEQLSEDIQRHLEDRPVTARPDTWGYRARKFIGRNKLPVAATALVALSLAAGGIATAYQAGRAERRFQQVRKLAKVFLFDLDDRIVKLQGSTDTRRFVVRTGLDYLASLEREAGGDVELLTELARAYRRVGDVQGNPLISNLGDPAGAMDSYRKAAAILEKLARGRPPLEVQLARAEIYGQIGDIQVARGDQQSALQTQRTALQIVEQLTNGPADARVLKIQGDLHNRVARTLNFQGEIAEVLKHASMSVGILQKLAAIAPSTPNLSELSISHRFMGNALEKSGRRPEALTHYLEALRIREQLAGRDRSDPGPQRNLMLAYSLLGDYLKSPVTVPRDFAGALGHYRKMLEIAEWLTGLDARDHRARVDLSHSLLRVGTTLSDLAQFEEALGYLRRSLSLTSNLLAADSSSYTLRYNAVFLQDRIAHTLLLKGKPEEALPHSRAAVASAEHLIVKTPGNREAYYQALVNYRTHVKILGRTGDLPAIEKASRRILELADETHPKKYSNQTKQHAAPQSMAAAGEAHALLAQRAAGTPARLALWKKACSWFSMSLERWNEIRKAGAAEGLFESGPAEVQKQLASCEAELRGQRE